MSQKANKNSRDRKDEQRIVSNIYERSALHRSASCFAMITSLPWGLRRSRELREGLSEYTTLPKDLKLSESLKCQRFNENIVNETLVCSLMMAKIFNFPDKNEFSLKRASLLEKIVGKLRSKRFKLAAGR